MKTAKKIDEVYEIELIAELKGKIAAHRKRHPEEARFPKRIRSLILRSLDQGVSSNKLGRAVGISGRAIRYWQKSAAIIAKAQTKRSRVLKGSFKREDARKTNFIASKFKPRELTVTEEPEVASLFQAKRQDRATGNASVLLCSGVRIELEMSALDSDFLFRLNQIGGA